MNIGQGRTVAVVGAGLGGALAAIYLARMGFRVNVYERRGDPRRVGYTGGRSINLALSARGLWGLEGVGLREAVLARAIPMRGRMVHSAQGGTPEFHAYSKNPTDAINSISRSELNIALLEACERHDGIELFFNQRCLDADLDKPSVTFANDGPEGGGAVGTVEADLVIGADGAFSPIRGRMQKSDRFEYSQTYLAHGYKELHIPAPATGTGSGAGREDGFAMDPNALHIWPRKSAMMIALPNLDKSFTCTLFWPFAGEHGFDRLTTREQVLAFFKNHYPDAVELMPTLAEDYLANPVSSLVTVRCWPWVAMSRQGRGTVLLGDAAHAIVPFFGQGMNAAFEDCRVLAECVERHAGDLNKALAEYQTLRKPNADAIADMALDNFVEMRDKVGTPGFKMRKRFEHFLHELFPGTLTPKYNLVSFSTVPYVQAKAQGERLDKLVRGLGVMGVILALLVLVVLRIPAWTLLVIVVVLGWLYWERTGRRG